jgi:acyl-CoA thioesterase YciA
MVGMTIDLFNDQPTSRVTAMPSDANPDGDIFGGWCMSQMDLAAASVAARRAQGRCVTVAVDGMQFLSPVFIGDEVSIYASVAKVGRTSLAIKVEAFARRQYTEDTDKVTEATFTFVKIGPDRKPRVLPPLV